MKAIGIDLGLHNSVEAIRDPHLKILESSEMMPRPAAVDGLKQGRSGGGQFLVRKAALDNSPACRVCEHPAL